MHEEARLAGEAAIVVGAGQTAPLLAAQTRTRDLCSGDTRSIVGNQKEEEMAKRLTYNREESALHKNVPSSEVWKNYYGAFFNQV